MAEVVNRNCNGASPPLLDARCVVRAELARITDRFDAAARRALTAGVYDRQGEREAAEAERLDAGDFWRAETDLADLLCLLLRMAVKHQPDAVRALLTGALEEGRSP